LIPFFSTGFSGVSSGAGLVFFAFIGFDMVACMSEEVVDPGRNMPIGIVGSLVVSAIIYISVSLVVVGMAPINLLGGEVPITNALLINGCCTHEQQLEADALSTCLSNSCPAIHTLQLFSSRIVGLGAIFALTSATFVGLMGQPRIFYSMAKDGLLFPIFGEVDPITKVPTKGIIITGITCALLACFVDLQVLATVISLGTLLVFSFVDAAVIILRLRPWHEHVQLSERAFVFQTPEVSRHNSVDDSVASPSLANYDWMSVLQSESVRENGSKPTIAVTLFGIFTLLLSFGVRDSWPTVILWIFGGSVLLCTGIIIRFPRSNPPETFTCPWVPMIPLMGMGANLFMAGSLSASCWGLSMMWMGLGLSVYLFYGIHHSSLNKVDPSQHVSNDEVSPLVLQGACLQYNATLHSGKLLPPIAQIVMTSEVML
jgi:basic amino acid/polyamine antiporter, APA family